MIGVPDKFNTVDMGGIDVVKAQGEKVDGLFLRLLNSIQDCRYSVLCNWFFAEIPVAPAYVELVFDGEQVSINDLITVTPDDIVHVSSLQSTILPLNVEENGRYVPPSGVDGYSPVIVNVGGDPPLPAEFQEVEYIESTGIQYTTPMILTIPAYAIINFRFARMNGTDEQAAFGMHANSALTSGVIEIGIAAGASSVGPRLWGRTNDYLVKSYETGTTGNPCSGSVLCVSGGNNQHITLCKYKSYLLNGRLYACSILKLKDTYSPDNPYETMFKAVPCYRKADDEIGFYELVSGTFLTNAGSGTFGKGPDVNSVD